MLSIEELNNFKNRNDFVNLLKKKLPKKRFEKIIAKSDYNNQIIQLQSDLVNLQNWVKKNNKRPLLFKKNTNEEVKKIYFERKKIYNEADFRIKCDSLRSEQIANKILNLYEKSGN